MPRRLAAIVFTDIVGFTALMQRDEKAALRLLQDQESLVPPLLEAHRGRLVKTIADALLIEFPTALDAVEFGVDFQRLAHERNARPGLEPLRLRVGIHSGDVQEVRNDIFGDAVNVASRIESLADPGVVLLSEPVYAQVRSSVAYEFEKLGARTLKGVQGPVSLYRAVLPWEQDEVPPRHFPSRRLAAIMYTDVVGFTASAQANEADALARLREQERIVRPLFEPYKGREIKSTGDGFLVEFESALGALECAVEIQRRMRERNAEKPRLPLELRIGIHVGDVEESGGDIFGDAVNIASRVEPLAEPGGVCVSEPVFVQVRNKVPYRMEELGPKSLKGVREPIGIYRVALVEVAESRPPRTSAFPRIAVLPLTNISPDPKDEYFADGLTEELITTLSQLRELRVIARSSVVQYKANPRSVSQIGAELGVRSILEGSVRKAGDRLRITVQLIDVSSQEHTWADTYDRSLDDVFAIQADVAQRIAQMLKVKIGSSEQARIVVRPSVRPESYLAYLCGRAIFSTGWRAKADLAKKEFEQAIALDSTNAAAYSGLSDTEHVLGEGGLLGPGRDWYKQAKHHALKALELDPNLAEAHASLGALLYHEYDFSGSEKELRLAVSLNPSSSFTRLAYGILLDDLGRTEEAIRELRLAGESDPHSPAPLFQQASLLIRLRRLDDALPLLDRLSEFGEPEYWVHLTLAYYHGARGDFARAYEEVDLADRATQGQCWDDRIFLFAAAGDRAKAVELLAAKEREPDAPTYPGALAWCHGSLGNLDQCFHWLGKAIESYEFDPRVWRTVPELEPVRRDPRFALLLKRIDLE